MSLTRINGRSTIVLASLVVALGIISLGGGDSEGQALAAELGAPKPGMVYTSALTATPTSTTTVPGGGTISLPTPPTQSSATAVPATATPAVQPTSTAGTGSKATSTSTPSPTATTTSTIPAATATPTAPAATATSTAPVATATSTATSTVPVATATGTAVTFTPTLTATPTATVVKSNNDDFDGAALINAFPFSTTQDTTRATTAADDPNMELGAGVNSNTVWFKFVAPSQTGVRLDTHGSNYDTVLAVFTGPRGNLVPVASNDDAGASILQSELIFNAQAGTTYLVEVAQYGSAGGGSMRLNASLGPVVAATAVPTVAPTSTPWPTLTPWPTSTPWATSTPGPTATTVVVGQAPANDHITSASVIATLPFSLTLNTTGATSAVDDPDMMVGSGKNSNTVWFSLAASASGDLRVTTSGSSYDTVLAVFSGTPGNLTLVANNDDVSNDSTVYDGTSDLTFNAVPGTSYYIEVGQFGEPAGGQLRLAVSGTAALSVTPPAFPTVTAPSVAGFTSTIPTAPVRRAAIRDNRYYALTGFRVDGDNLWDFFLKRGGVRTFGYPVSWEFTLLGFKVQFFQRAILQEQPNGSVVAMNLLDAGLMPYTRINSSVFPGPEKALIEGAPSPSDPEYGAQAIAFIEANVPDEWDGLKVNFLDTYLSTVTYEDAFPNGEGDRALVPLLNLELFGLPTSAPAYDPNNRNFVYQRFQRGILHFDATTGATQGLLLADYLKSIITGSDLPSDLDLQARGSRFYRQLDPSRAGSMVSPQQLPETNLTGAFVSDLQ